MNPITESLNAFGPQWALWLGASILDATVVLLLVAVIWLAVRRHAAPQLGYLLFLLVLAKLFVPIEIVLPGSLPRWAPLPLRPPALASSPDAHATTLPPSVEALAAEDRDNQAPSPRIAEWTADPDPDAADLAFLSGSPAPPASEPSRLSLSAALMLAWAVAVTLLLARFVHAQFRFHREMRNALPLDPQRLPIDLPELRARVGVKQPVRIVESSAVASPAIWGIIRPTLILPVGIAAALSARQLEWVLLHELAHVKRRDLAVSGFQRLVQIVHFANPAVWIANRIVNRLREFACDDLATSLCGGSPADPGEAFLSIVRHAADNRRRRKLNLEGALGVFDSAARASCFQRMKRLLDTDRRVRLRLGAGSVCLLLLAGAIALPQIRAAADPTPEDRGDGEKNENPAQPVPPAAENGTKPEPRADFAVVVARHVLLLDGKEIVTWQQIEGTIAALPDPSKAHPHFYITRGAAEAGIDKTAKEEIWRLHRDYKLAGHSQGSLWPRSDWRYDRIKTPADLKPDESLRLEGQVVDPAGKPAAGVEIVLVMPVDESIPYKTYHIALVQGRVRNRLEHVLTQSDDDGRFAVYPPKEQRFSIVALHPERGFALVDGDQFKTGRKVRLLEWAGLVSEFAEEPEKQDASLSTSVAESDGRPEIIFNQYWTDLKERRPTLLFGFTHVPPIYQTTISRSFPDKEGTSFSLPGASVSLLPGETRRLDLGPLSKQQREHLEQLRRDLQQRPQGATPEDVTTDRGQAAAHQQPAGRANAGKATEPDADDLTFPERVLLSRGTRIGDIRRLRARDDVRDLVLHGQRISDDELRELADYTPQMIGFAGTNVKGPGLKHLNVSALENLQLIGPQVTDTWLENLPEIPTLRNLNLSGSRTTDAGLKHLRKFPNLERLNVSGTRVGDSGMRSIGKLPRLESLTLTDTQVSDQGLMALKGLIELTWFSLSSPNVQGHGLAFLQETKKLEELTFVGPHATNQWLQHVEPLRSVTWLQLHNTSITDEGLASISQWQNLRKLHLNLSPITDGGLAHLKNLYLLDSVALKDTRVTDAGAAELRRALPDTGITR